MFVGICRIELHLPGCQSLKDKRVLLRSLLDRLRKRYNLSVAEVDGQDLWQRCTLGFSNVNSSKGGAERTIAEVIRYVEREDEMEIIKCEVDVL